MKDIKHVIINLDNQKTYDLVKDEHMDNIYILRRMDENDHTITLAQVNEITTKGKHRGTTIKLSLKKVINLDLTNEPPRKPERPKITTYFEGAKLESPRKPERPVGSIYAEGDEIENPKVGEDSGGEKRADEDGS